MIGSVSSAISSEAVSRVISFLTGKCSEHKNVPELIDRLKMLHIKLESAIEVAKATDINIEQLHEWLEMLIEATSVAAEVLITFEPNKTIEGGSSSTVHPASNMTEVVCISCLVNVEEKLPLAKLPLATTLKYQFRQFLTFSRVHEILDLLFPNGQLLKPRMMVDKYLENDEKVSKLIKTVEKLEKMSGDIGDFIELLKLQSKRKMSRKRKRSARPRRFRGFFLVISLKSQIYALFCYGEDPYLLVIMLFRTYCNVPTGITDDIFMGFIM